MLLSYLYRMRSIIFFAFILFCFVACSDKKDLPSGPESVMQLRDSFPEHDLKDFTTIPASFTGIANADFHEIDSVCNHLIWQGTKEYSSFDPDFYYSWQNRDTSFTELS